MFAANSLTFAIVSVCALSVSEIIRELQSPKKASMEEAI